MRYPDVSAAARDGRRTSLRPWVRSVVMVCVVLSLPGAAAFAAEELTPQKLRRAASLSARGLKAMQAGNRSQAEQRFREALEVVSVFPDAHFGLGQLAMSGGKFEEALAAFERARDGYVYMEGEVFSERMRNYERAQQELTALRASLEQARHVEASQNPPDPEIAHTIARLEQKVAALEQIRPPTDQDRAGMPPELFFFMGNAQMRLGRVDDAIASWEETLARDPKFAAVYNNLAIAYARKGRFDEATRSLDRAEELGLEVPDGLRHELERLEAESKRTP